MKYLDKPDAEGYLKYKYSTQSATEDYRAQDLEEHYRGKVFFTFLGILSQEQHRRFKGKDDTPTGLIISGLHCLTIPQVTGKA